jgi:hypothetical protein
VPAAVYPGVSGLCVRVQYAPEESFEVGRHLDPLKQVNQLDLAHPLTGGRQSVSILIFNMGWQSRSGGSHEANNASSTMGKCPGPRRTYSRHWPDGPKGTFGNSLQSNHAIPRPHHRDVR